MLSVAKKIHRLLKNNTLPYFGDIKEYVKFRTKEVSRLQEALNRAYRKIRRLEASLEITEPPEEIGPILQPTIFSDSDLQNHFNKYSTIPHEMNIDYETDCFRINGLNGQYLRYKYPVHTNDLRFAFANLRVTDKYIPACHFPLGHTCKECTDIICPTCEGHSKVCLKCKGRGRVGCKQLLEVHYNSAGFMTNVVNDLSKFVFSYYGLILREERYIAKTIKDHFTPPGDVLAEPIPRGVRAISPSGLKYKEMHFPFTYDMYDSTVGELKYWR